MTDKKKQPEVKSPEDLEQIRKYAKEAAKDLFNPEAAPDFDEAGVLSGSEDLLDKTDAELFPDEIEEYTPEERRKAFKVHTQNKDKK